MEETLISYPTAVLAKEKGFDERTWDFYWKGTLRSSPLDNGPGKWNSDKEYNTPDPIYTAPTQALLQKWLREVHDLYIDIESHIKTKRVVFYAQVLQKDAPLQEWFMEVGSQSNFPTYEEALEYALVKALNTIK